MSAPGFRFEIALDLFPLLSALLAATSCGLLGSFLLLRRQSMMGDAIGHSVLPGLVIAFLLSATREPAAMLLGAAIAGIATVLLVETLRRFGGVEPGAAMGVVFTVLFALGVLLIEQAAARHVDLDADCVLHGQLETLVWYGAPDSFAELLRRSTLEAVPRQIWLLAATALAALGFVALLFKELRLTAFDPDHATAQGLSATAVHALLMVLVALATVASFEAVGSILVVALLVCPAATARLLVDRLLTQVLLATLLAIAGAALGYLAATAVPSIWGLDSVNAAGAIAVTCGALLLLAALASPRHGLIVRLLRRRALAASVAQDDLLALLYRSAEAGRSPVTIEALGRLGGPAGARAIRAATISAVRAGLVALDGDRLSLTAAGSDAGAELVRRHRLWETYLVEEAGLLPDHVHETAERLEHLRTAPPSGPTRDPHGRKIPGPPGR